MPHALNTRSCFFKMRGVSDQWVGDMTHTRTYIYINVYTPFILMLPYLDDCAKRPHTRWRGFEHVGSIKCILPEHEPFPSDKKHLQILWAGWCLNGTSHYWGTHPIPVHGSGCMRNQRNLLSQGAKMKGFKGVTRLLHF